MRELEYHYNGIAWWIIWDLNKAIDIGKWPICGCDRSEKFKPIYIRIDIHIYIYVCVCVYMHTHFNSTIVLPKITVEN